jgi:hypothetical protein
MSTTAVWTAILILAVPCGLFALIAWGLRKLAGRGVKVIDVYKPARTQHLQPPRTMNEEIIEMLRRWDEQQR